MRTAIIGPGRLGTLLAVACTRAGHRVTDVGGGTRAARERLASHVAGARLHAHPADTPGEAQLVLLAVPDDRIAWLATELAAADVLRPGHRLVHFAGALGPGALDVAGRAGASIAACHPAMTVPDGSLDPQVLVGIAWAVTAAPADRAWTHEFVRDLGGDPHDVPADRRALYHAALAVGSNAVAAATATARQLLLAASVRDPAAFLRPLAHASVDAVIARGAVALTGPLARGDRATIEGHLRAIDADVPALGDSYRRHALATLGPLRHQLDPETLSVLESLLHANDGEA